MTDRGMNTLALRGLEEPFFQLCCCVVSVFVLAGHLLCVGWRNLFSFPVVLLCQFFVLAGNRLWFYILLMYLGVQYSCGVVFSFFGSVGK
jgi:hypothetical protein